MRPFPVILAIAAGALVSGIGCSSSSSGDVLAARQLPEAIRAEARAVAQANNQFACDLYGELADGNAFFSPFSISTALSMIDAGAAGDTDTELRAALHVAVPGDGAHAAYGALLDSLDVGRGFGGYTLATADRLFGQEGFPFLESYLATTRDHYDAELMAVDFDGDVEGARSTVNAWVAEQTEDKIPELFEPGQIDASAVLVLANAILFKGTWEHQFEQGGTTEAPFRLADGSTVTVQMMSKDDVIAQTVIPGGRLGVLPFKGQDLAMVVLLPDDPDGLPALEAQLTGPALDEWIAASELGDKKAPIWLPKFEMEASLPLVEMLKTLGITSAFDPDLADLSAMDGARDLYLQTIVHKAVIKVDEQGAEAAAATGGVVTDVSAPEPFEADRPFAFLIYDQVTGSILFMGRVADPTAPSSDG
jgi:serine protease inhibitor